MSDKDHYVLVEKDDKFSVDYYVVGIRCGLVDSFGFRAKFKDRKSAVRWGKEHAEINGYGFLDRSE